MRLFALLAFFSTWFLFSSTTDAATAPTGIYVSAGPTSADRDSIVPGYEGLDFIDGVLVRIGWGEIETSPGTYDWSALDRQFSLAQQMGLQVALGVTNGGNAPAWLSDMGVGFFDFVRPDRVGVSGQKLRFRFHGTRPT